MFKVSVIIPVFNAEKFLRNSVESALALSEVGEVILIEDNSPDDCLRICRELEKTHDKVKLFTHPNGENKGAGESRNLGVRHATFDYIAFLDADDYYLPKRFKGVKEIFEENNEVDFVFSISQYEKDYFAKNNNYRAMILPEKAKLKVFDYLLNGKYGYFNTNSITIKKDSLQKVDGFTTLKLHEDSELWLRIAYKYKGVQDKIKEPVSLVRQHQDNRITKENYSSKYIYWKILWEEFKGLELTKYQRYTILFHYKKYKYSKLVEDNFIKFNFYRVCLKITTIIYKLKS